MKKLFITFSLIVCSFLIVIGQERPILKFNSLSRFKIVQFTDIHIQYDSYRSDSALVMMKTVIEREKPDLVILTGDVVGSDNRKKAWLKVAQVMIDSKTPWAAMLGNHDAEYELNKQQTMDAIVGLPYNLTISGPEEIAGAGNFVLPIQSSSSDKTAALCYVLDVSATNRPPENHTGVYEWIDDSQVEWYKRQSTAYTKQNGGKPLPALAFFHIPFPEYNEVVGKSTTVGYQAEVHPTSPDSRSNLYAALQDCKDVMGTFAGHQHNNNYIGCLNGICLAFGQTSGRQVYGERGSGARVIVLHEGQRKFESWILKLYDNSRELDIWTPTQSEEKMFFVSYPESFVPKIKNPGRINMITREGSYVSFRLSGSGKATINWGDGSEEEVVTLNENISTEVKRSFPGSTIRAIAVHGEDITSLDCSGNKLTYLDVSKNTELIYLDCSDNQLNHLDVTHNIALKELWCNSNYLTNLNLNKNVGMVELYCHNNSFVTIDISNNTNLERLNCSQNVLTKLDLSMNTKLNRMDCYENRLTALDLSKNTIMNYAVCTDNQIAEGDLNALFKTLYIGAGGTVFVGGNPGEKECDRNIAESRGWKVRLRY
ncbi:MAG TPA: metallophosphoesterase [Mariniphaga sp.]|nr:metallophosphoesterase [Mariniphaga sp.]